MDPLPPLAFTVRRRGVLAALGAAGLLAACAVGPDYQRPELPAAAAYSPRPLPEHTASSSGPAGDAQRFAADRDLDFDWWKQFGSDKLNALVEHALKSNPSIPAAEAALRQAHEMTAAQRGFFFPTVQASFSPSRQKNPVGTIAPTLSSGVPVYNLFTPQLAVGYTLDVFGANRRQVESLQAQADLARFQLEATYVTLVDNVVGAAIQEGALREQISAVEQFIASNARALEILRKQFQLGYAMRLDVAAQEQALAQAQQMLPPLQKQLDQTHDLLRALAGELPGTPLDDRFDFSTLHLPAELPVSLPSKLIEQRPDVRAAEAQLHAASANVGVARAARLPQFTLAAALGGTSTGMGSLFAAGNRFWSLGATLSETLFDGGTLRHHEHAAIAALDQAGALYRSTVISAFQNVADTLHAIESDADYLASSVAAEQAARLTLDVTRKQFDSGYVNFLILLSAQEAYQQSRLILVQAQANRFVDAAALYQSLGGGWWNRSKLAQAAEPEPAAP